MGQDLLAFAVLVLLLGSFGFWVWTLFEVTRFEPSHGRGKVFWLLLVSLTYALGAAVYFLVRRPRRIREARSAKLAP